MSLEQMAKIYGCKKNLFSNEYFTLENYKEVIGDLKKMTLNHLCVAKYPQSEKLVCSKEKIETKPARNSAYTIQHNLQKDMELLDFCTGVHFCFEYEWD